MKEIKVINKMDLTRDVESFASLYTELREKAQQEENNNVSGDLDGMKFNFDKVASVAQRFDYKEVKSNGYRVTLFVVVKLLQECSKGNQKDVKRRPAIIKFANFYLNQAANCLASTPHNSNQIEPMTLELFFNSLQTDFHGMRDELQYIVGPLAGLAYTDDARAFYSHVLAFAATMGAKNSYRVMKQAFSSKFMNRSLVNMVLDADLDFYVKLLRGPEKWLPRTLMGLANLKYRDIQMRTVYMDVKPGYEYVVADGDVKLIKSDSGIENRVRCRVYRAKGVKGVKGAPLDSDPKSVSVLFYLHGGAYISGSPESYESMLPEFARQLGPQVAVVAVDYRMAPEHRFPAGLQVSLICNMKLNM